MAAGQQNNIKVAFIIQARMKSTRLPGKILLPLPFNMGKPLIKWILDEAKLSKYSGDVIVATSVNSENDILFNYCIQNSIQCYRGDEENVLSRFIALIKANTYDVVVRLTADNPILDIKLLDETIDYHLNNYNDYTKTEGLPLGMNFEIIRPDALLTIANQPTTDYDNEHVTPAIINSDNFKKEIYKPELNNNFKNIRLTVDYLSDYLLLSTIANVSLSKKLKGINLIEDIYSSFKLIFEINNSNVQKNKYNTLTDEIKAACSVLNDLEMQRASQILMNHEA